MRTSARPARRTSKWSAPEAEPDAQEGELLLSGKSATGFLGVWQRSSGSFQASSGRGNNLGCFATAVDAAVAVARHKGAQEEIEVRADSRVSLNGRARQPLIDSRVDLSRAPRTVAPYEWVLPLNEPLQSQR